MAEGDVLPIGRFARATGLTVNALRLYADAGVLMPAQVDPASGYRYYRVDQIASGQVVRVLRQVGVAVAELADVLAAIDDGADVRALLGARLRADEEQVAVRRRLIESLDRRCGGADMTRQITSRTWDTDPALRVRAAVAHTEHDAFIRASYQKLYTAAGHDLLTLSGPGYQRYHARVDDEDTRVTVEACLPFAPGRAEPTSLPDGVDVLPAGSMTFVSTTMRGADTTYPTILEGTDAVAEWMARHGFDYAGPAYEIVRRWMGEPGHAGNVVEVGFPVSG